MKNHIWVRRRLSIEERLDLDSIPEPNTGCILWLGCVDKNGYGKIYVNKKHARAHRVAYEIENGPIPDGMSVLHKCDNPLCINPQHLVLGNNQDNMTDMVKKSRQARGHKIHNSKLTEKQISEIRELAKNNKRYQSEIGRRYNVNKTTISSIILGKTWGHIA